MTTSIIIPTYKDTCALKLILDALQLQTYKDFEVIIAEDNDSIDMINFLTHYKSDLRIRHFSQHDSGNQKAMILNKSLSNINSDYIIFIDGDTIPYTTFIQSHIELAEPKTILCGRRVNLGDKVSKDLRDGKTTSLKLEQSYFMNYKYINNDNNRHYEQGIRFKPTSFFYKLINNKDSNIHILGSNFSCFKKELDEINGFDENIIGGSKDDVDLEWRFKMNGCKFKSAKFCANLFHLNHPRYSRVDDEEIAKNQMNKNKKNKRFICTNGIIKNV